MLSDTSAEAHRVQIELLRKATVAERVAKARSLTTMAVGLSRRAIAQAHPHWTLREVELKFVELHYGKKLAAELRDCLEEQGRCSPRMPGALDPGGALGVKSALRPPALP